MAGLSLQTQHSPLYPLLTLSFRICIVNVSRCPISDIFFCREPSYRLPFLLEHPSEGSSWLTSGPADLIIIIIIIILIIVTIIILDCRVLAEFK